MATTRNRVRVHLPAVVAAALAVVVGCAAPEAAAPPVAPPVAVPTTAAALPTTPQASPLPAAADGDDLAACADGACEVRVVSGVDIPLPRRSGITARVAEVAGPLVRVQGTWPGGSAETIGRCDGCGMRLVGPGADSPGEYEARASVGTGVRVNDHSIVVVAAGAGEAVVRVRPA